MNVITMEFQIYYLSLISVFLPSGLFLFFSLFFLNFYLFRYFSINFILIYVLFFFLCLYLLFLHSLSFLDYFSLFVKHSVVYTEHNSKIMLNYLFQKANRENLWNTPNFRQYITGSKCILLAVVFIFVFRLRMNSYE